MRMTPQTKAVIDELQKSKHATNATLFQGLKGRFPDLSVTTIHRITKRLVDERVIGVIHSPLDGSLVLDANPEPHFHFGCRPCGAVTDINLSVETVNDLQKAIGTKIVPNDLTVIGIQETCPNYHH